MNLNRQQRWPAQELLVTSRAQTEPIEHASEQTLTSDELRSIDAYWRACNYLCAGMIYLRDNPLLKEPLLAERAVLGVLGLS